ncbi:MAG: hypothetical protein ACTSYC_04495 [Promethearchaeota archaeon]
MSKIIEDLWIMNNNSGIVVFSRVFDEKLDSQLFGGFINAINSFSEELNKEGLSSFELSKKQFIILKEGDFLFIASSNPKIKEKKVLSELKVIASKFFEKYSHVLKDWDNDISVFSDFEKVIEDSLEKVISKFKQAFWE